MEKSLRIPIRISSTPSRPFGTSRNADGVAWKSLPWWQHRGYRITHEQDNEWTRRIGPAAREIRMRKDLL